MEAISGAEIVELFDSELGREITQGAADLVADYLTSTADIPIEQRLDTFIATLVSVLNESSEGDGDQHECLIDLGIVQSVLSTLNPAEKETQDEDEDCFGGQSLPAPSVASSCIFGSQGTPMARDREPNASSPGSSSNQEETYKLASEISRVLKQVKSTILISDIQTAGTAAVYQADGCVRYETPRRDWKRVRDASIITTPLSSSIMMRQRWRQVSERVRRDPTFAWWADSENESRGQRTMNDNRELVKTTEQVIGCLDLMCTILGFLRRQRESGDDTFQWVMEDLDNQKVLLNVEHCVFQESFFLDGHVVMATGVVDRNHCFHVCRMRHPPPALDQIRLSPLKSVTDPIYSHEQMKLMTTLEMEFDELKRVDSLASISRQAWVFVNECKFDDPIVIERLRALFNVFESVGVNADNPRDLARALRESSDDSASQGKGRMSLPAGFVLMGDFSQWFSPKSDEPERIIKNLLPSASMWAMKKYSRCSRYVQTWLPLLELLSETPLLVEHCHFLLVPGPTDPGLPILPRPSIPLPLTGNIGEELRKTFPRANLKAVGNPVRINHFSRRLMVLRANTFSLYTDRRHSLHRPEMPCLWPTSAELAKWTSTMLLGQGHAYPVPLPSPERVIHTMPAYDSLLWLDPVPDLLVVADDTCPNWSHETADGTKIVSLGAFGKNQHNNGSWAMYDVTSGSLELFDSSDLTIEMADGKRHTQTN